VLIGNDDVDALKVKKFEKLLNHY